GPGRLLPARRADLLAAPGGQPHAHPGPGRSAGLEPILRGRPSAAGRSRVPGLLPAAMGEPARPARSLLRALRGRPWPVHGGRGLRAGTPLGASLVGGLRLRGSVAVRVAVAGGTCALALSAPLWLPTLAIVRSGGRAHMDPSLNAYWSVHPATLVDLFVPGAVSTLPLTPATREELFEGREPFL